VPTAKAIRSDKEKPANGILKANELKAFPMEKFLLALVNDCAV
jgi:hypothetical protein